MPELNSTGTATRAWEPGDELLAVAEGGSGDDSLARLDRLPASIIDGLSEVALTGDYDDLQNRPATFPPSSHGHPAEAISDSTAAGRALLTAADAAAQRLALAVESSTQLNARDTANRARGNHTGTQLAETISDFAAAAKAAQPPGGTAGKVQASDGAGGLEHPFKTGSSWSRPPPTRPSLWPHPHPRGRAQRLRESPLMSMSEIQTIRPIAPYLGGKRNLARRICAIIDRDTHDTYAEPFVGMGGIFLRRTRRPRAEFINDRGREVYTLFRMLQEHYVAFLDLLRFQITTQANFERLVAVDPETLTDLQRAARFLYLQRLAFGGKISGRNFGVATERPARFNLTTLEPDLEALHTRLSGVTVMNLDYAAFIDRIDRPGTLFYLDPPYYGNEDDYGKGLFSRARFEEMADQLSRIKGRFLLSLNDHPDVRQIFGRFHLTDVRTTYSVGSKKTVEEASRGELVIANWRC